MSTFGTYLTTSESPAAVTPIHVGTAAPSAGVGRDGDFYLQTTTATLFGPKNDPDSGWASVRGHPTPTIAGDFGGQYIMGQRITTVTAGRIAGIRMYKAASDGQTSRAVRLYNATTQALLASATLQESATLNTWNEVTFPTPTTATAGQVFMACYDWTAGGYSKYGSSMPVSTQPSYVTYGQCGYQPGSNAYPGAQSTTYDLLVDVVFQYQGAPQVWPVALKSA